MINLLRTSRHTPAQQCLRPTTPRSHAPAWERIRLVAFTLALSIAQTASAENWLSLAEEPYGKTSSPPLQLERYPLGENTEKHFPPNQTFTLWVQDETLFKPHEADTIEIKTVLEKEVETFRLQNAVPEIGFASGKAEIPTGYVEQLRTVLNEMKNRSNVRLHFIGHSDSDKLSQALRVKFINNIGLSKHRAQITAEFFQRELDLAPDAVTFDGVGAAQPVASNTTTAGKRKNRRVEVQVWYDQVTKTAVEKEIVIPAERLNRLKVCRKETVCILSYKEGNARRARLQNLVKPLRIATGQAGVPDEFIRQISEALNNLRDKSNLVVRFVGHTDDMPLMAAEKRIYGNHANLSKARGRYTMLEVQDRLSLPNRFVSSSGKGLRYPIASNSTEKGRSFNRRVEVEFWYDDPFEQFLKAAQACPESAASEVISRTFDPPSGPIKAIRFKDGQPIIPEGYSERLARLLKDTEDKVNVRLSFTGFTSNKRLNRRTAIVYGDDIGLSASRARRTMEIIQQQMGLTDEQVEFEGRGFVHSDDVVATGFIQFDGSRVEVKILYDVLALLDDHENLEIERITRQAQAQNPFALNLMRITVDGEPLFDPFRHSQDIQRCTDVALQQASIQFKFNAMQKKPRLHIAAWPNTIRYQDKTDTAKQENKVHFKMYSNYGNFIQGAEVRLFNLQQSTRSEPLAIVPLNDNKRASWQAEFEHVGAAVKRLVYVLRVYDAQGNFDETIALPLWVVNELDENAEQSTRRALDDSSEIEQHLLAGYGENHLHTQQIEIDGGTVTIHGEQIPSDHNVWLAGRQVPVNDNGEFVSEELFPRGLHTIEVAVLDDAGNGELFLRDMEFARSNWFYVGLGDITVARDKTSGPARLVTQDEDLFNNDINVIGRFAYYVEGQFGDNWQLTSSADTQEAPFDELFSNFLKKDQRALLRRLDPDLFYPTFADDSTLEERAPTSGKLYLRLQRHNNYGILGNFSIGYLDTTLTHIDRGLYGVTGHYESRDYTSFGEQKFQISGFAAEPGTVAGRDEFRATGGSLYFLRHQDVLIGSDRLRVEVRDKDSGMVIGVKNLVPVIDYDFDYLQGRVLLSQPLASLADDGLLVSDTSLSGNPVYLVARYEFSPGFDEIDTLAIGGRTHYWFNDSVKLGATLSAQKQDQQDSELHGIDLTLRKSAASWLRFEIASSEGGGADELNSIDGGFSFNELGNSRDPNAASKAYRLEGSFLVNDVISGGADMGSATFYAQQSEAGFSAPGQLTASDLTLMGGHYNTALTQRLSLDVKVDSRNQKQSLKTEALDVSTSYQATDRWRFSGGGRADSREDNTANVAATQKQGDRLDLAAEAHYDSKSNWTAYGFAQATAAKSGNREDNHRFGGGGSIRPTDRLILNGEASLGSLGTGVTAGMDYLVSTRTNVYSAYTLENARSDNGVRSMRGNWNNGVRSRFTDTLSMYTEQRYSHGDVPTGLTHAFGVDYVPDERWNFGGNIEAGELEDKNTGAETNRKAIGLNAGYNFGAAVYSVALEYRVDETEDITANTSKRSTWLMKNNLHYQVDQDWRFLAKANFSQSDSSLGKSFSGNFSEIVMGYGYRPVNHDRLNTLFKYTYFYNVPFGELSATDPLSGQVVGSNAPIDFIQKSHILSLDAIYDLTQRWSIGGKYAYRLGQVAQDRLNPEFFDSRASLYILRADWHFTHRWDALIEARLLDLPDAEDRRSGALLGLYRHVGKNIKIGVGYNFTDFSDDLTDLSFNSQGVFVNFVGKI